MIRYCEEKKLFQLDTINTTYVIGLTQEGYVGHVYYGDRLFGEAVSTLLRTEEPPFTPSKNLREKSAFLDFFPMEYPTGGIGDYRESCLDVRNEAGSKAAEILYFSHVITNGKPRLEGLPASFGNDDEVQTLVITCKDLVLGLSVDLMYSVFEKEDVIVRSTHVTNEGSQMVSSTKGESSHQEHPFQALVTKGCDQEHGKVYAMHFVYSGNFIAQTERTQFDMVRMVMGISAEEFCWQLTPGSSFQAPEVVCVYSSEGLGKMSRSYHDFYRSHMIRSPYNHSKRPILINNWEATYFNFDTQKLLAIAKEAKACGIEMLVMDDGWFGHRNNDDSSLGDWKVNTDKIKGGLKYLVDEVNKIGLEFGIWFEPEMISPDSDLYRAHPDWAIHIDGRAATQSRCQYVLDLSRKEVRDYVYDQVSAILHSANIRYVKWDMNRQLSDLGSSYLSADHKEELFHRYVLGVYELQERLVTEFPNLLLENCSGGGARFDPGMLYYSPQIWCSDDTDAIERLLIQEGTSLIYPLCSMGAHVSDCPNHTVGRVTPFETRGHVALAGTFGYELDVTKIPKEDREQIPQQIAMYHKYHELVREGDYYRIASYSENHLYDCWAVSAKDKSEVLVTYVQVLSTPNAHSRKLYLKGFEPQAVYRLEETGETFTGEILEKYGYLIRPLWGDFRSKLLHFTKI